MDGLLKLALDWLMAHAAEVLLALLSALMAYGIVLLRKLPKLLHDLASKMAEEAKKSPGQADDVAAKLLLVLADVLASVLAKHFGGPKVGA